MKSSLFLELGANGSWERKKNPCLVRGTANAITIYIAKGMTLRSECTKPTDVLCRKGIANNGLKALSESTF